MISPIIAELARSRDGSRVFRLGVTYASLISGSIYSLALPLYKQICRSLLFLLPPILTSLNIHIIELPFLPLTIAN